jgi:hypothetical protein
MASSDTDLDINGFTKFFTCALLAGVSMFALKHVCDQGRANLWEHWTQLEGARLPPNTADTPVVAMMSQCTRSIYEARANLASLFRVARPALGQYPDVAADQAVVLHAQQSCGHQLLETMPTLEARQAMAWVLAHDLNVSLSSTDQLGSRNRPQVLATQVSWILGSTRE